MRIASAALHLGAAHAKTVIHSFGYGIGIQLFIKAGPATARIELGL
jgi:hypothetical protein